MQTKLKNKIKIVIAGAGCAGLAAGIALKRHGFDVTIVEQASRVGGLAGGIEFNGNIYEYGPHIFHTTDQEVLADVKKIAGHLLIPIKPTIKIKFLKSYFSFPLSLTDILTKLPLLTVIHAAFSFLKYFTFGIFKSENDLTNSEKVLQRYYGDVLYKLFFKNYIIKVWGIEPSDMAPSFAKQRIPRLDFLNFLDKIKKILSRNRKKNVSTSDYVEKVEGQTFTTKKGFSLITEAYARYFEDLGGKLLMNTRLSRVSTDQNHCYTEQMGDSKKTLQLEYDYFISTIPISNLTQLIYPKVSQAISSAANQLRFRGVIFIGLHVNKEYVLPASFMFFRDKSFNRITDLAHFDVEIHPKNTTTLIAEITCQPENDLWKNEIELAEKVIEELISEKLIAKEDVIEYHIFKSQYAYPTYTVGYEENLKTIFDELAAYKNIYTIGRQGRFAYINTHIAFKMGYEVAHEIAEKVETNK